MIPRLMNSSIREIPVTISAFSMGILVIPIKIVRFLRFIFCMAMQVMVPIKVAARAESSAMDNVFHKACMITALSNSSAYHLKVKPPHFALVLLALKDSTIKVTIGAYKKRKINAIYIFLAVVLSIIVLLFPLIFHYSWLIFRSPYPCQ